MVPEHQQNVIISSSLSTFPENFIYFWVILESDRQADRQINIDYHITFLAEVIPLRPLIQLSPNVLYCIKNVGSRHLSCCIHAKWAGGACNMEDMRRSCGCKGVGNYKIEQLCPGKKKFPSSELDHFLDQQKEKQGQKRYYEFNFCNYMRSFFNSNTSLNWRKQGCNSIWRQ